MVTIDIVEANRRRGLLIDYLFNHHSKEIEVTNVNPNYTEVTVKFEFYKGREVLKAVAEAVKGFGIKTTDHNPINLGINIDAWPKKILQKGFPIKKAQGKSDSSLNKAAKPEPSARTSTLEPSPSFPFTAPVVGAPVIPSLLGTVMLVHQRADVDKGKGKQQGSPIGTSAPSSAISAATPTAKHTPLVIRFEKLERSPKVQIGKGLRKVLTRDKVKFELEPSGGKSIRLDIQGGPSEVERAKEMLQELGCVVKGHRSRLSVLDIVSFHKDQIPNLVALNEKPKAPTRAYSPRKPRQESSATPVVVSTPQVPVAVSQEVSEVSATQEALPTEVTSAVINSDQTAEIVEAFLGKISDELIVFAKAHLGTDADGRLVVQTVTITPKHLGEILASVLAANK